MYKTPIIIAATSLGLMAMPGYALAIGDVCSNVEITFKNDTADEIKITKFQYYDYSADKWRTESMFGVDGHQKILPGKEWTKKQDLEHIEKDTTKFKATYQRHIGGTKWEDAVSTVTDDFTCRDKMRKTVTITDEEQSPAASNVTDCSSQETTEIGQAIDWGADNWTEFEKALEAFRGWPVNIGSCLENRFKKNGKVVCEQSSDGMCKGASGWASPLTKKCHMCPGFLATVRALPNLEDRQACYFALFAHEEGHTCERGHKTLEIIDDEAFNFWKSKHPGVTISLGNCGMN